MAAAAAAALFLLFNALCAYHTPAEVAMKLNTPTTIPAISPPSTPLPPPPPPPLPRDSVSAVSAPDDVVLAAFLVDDCVVVVAVVVVAKSVDDEDDEDVTAVVLRVVVDLSTHTPISKSPLTVYSGRRNERRGEGYRKNKPGRNRPAPAVAVTVTVTVAPAGAVPDETVGVAIGSRVYPFEVQ